MALSWTIGRRSASLRPANWHPGRRANRARFVLGMRIVVDHMMLRPPERLRFWMPTGSRHEGPVDVLVHIEAGLTLEIEPAANDAG